MADIVLNTIIPDPSWNSPGITTHVTIANDGSVQAYIEYIPPNLSQVLPFRRSFRANNVAELPAALSAAQQTLATDMLNRAKAGSPGNPRWGF